MSNNSSKGRTVAFWVLTALVVLGEGASGVLNLIGHAKPLDALVALGYPTYMLMILGPFKVAGVIALVIPRAARLKEWAYAGFAFSLIGGAASHIFNGDELSLIAPPIAVLAILMGSYALRPADRRL